jgi:hypothetical protein
MTGVTVQPCGDVMDGTSPGRVLHPSVRARLTAALPLAWRLPAHKMRVLAGHLHLSDAG